jgi:cyclophilin family peptidyl-prolyl cis-trans isomerase/FKBP-type peptidyl-prolyl cis-trans isomerase
MANRARFVRDASAPGRIPGGRPGAHAQEIGGVPADGERLRAPLSLAPAATLATLGLLALGLAQPLTSVEAQARELSAGEPARAQEQERAPLDPGLYGEILTAKGRIVFSLAFDLVPMTVANFVGLAEGTIRNQAFPPGTPYYDGSVFNRVAPGHVIQAGNAASGVAETPGYSIPNEIHPGLGNGGPGMVGMVNSGPHTGKSQFYITLCDRSYLDGDYAVFGEVVEGMDVVRTIERGDVIESLRIIRVGAEALAFRPTTESFRQMRREVWNRVRAAEEAQRQEDMAYLDQSWPHAVVAENGVRHVVLRPGDGQPMEEGDTVMVRYTGRTVRGLSFASTEGTGDPDYFWPGQSSGGVFSFGVGGRLLNPGFDHTVAEMSRGEKRLIIVPANVGYDPVGFYGRERPGEPRFVIRPGSILIYEVEVLGR